MIEELQREEEIKEVLYLGLYMYGPDAADARNGHVTHRDWVMVSVLFCGIIRGKPWPKG